MISRSVSRAVSRKADAISDAVEKLRYLRMAANRRGHANRRLAIASGVSALIAGGFLLNPGTKRLEAKAVALRPAALVTRQSIPLDELAPVWEVEQGTNSVLYSNGLQVRIDYVTNGSLRRYRVYSRDAMKVSSVRTAPAGIVFHTTESLLLPLEPGRSQSLVSTREDLLRYIRSGSLYNFVIDRFGQVFQVVPEEQMAFHAGNSIWADAREIYSDLNRSFIGVAFEARTGEEPTSAQIRSGRLLTDYLRVRWKIADENCVTHAQVSVNPDNMRIGYHTDWAARFPFVALGLKSGYAAQPAAVELFGFRYDETFLKSIGGVAWPGLIAAENKLRTEASQRGLDADEYRTQLQEKYRFLRSHAHEPAGNRDRT